MLKTPIYVSSKRLHVGMWHKWKNKGYNIISSWLNVEGAFNSENIGKMWWPHWLAESYSAPYLIFYAAAGDGPHLANLLEISASLTGGNIVLSVGQSDIMKTNDGEFADFTFHPKWQRCHTLEEAFKFASEKMTINQIQKYYGLSE
jgi:hypothetical protein